jgi:hypothetical protein
MSGSILGVGQTTHAETSDGTIPRYRGHPLAGPVSIGKVTFSTIFFKIVFPLSASA